MIDQSFSIHRGEDIDITVSLPGVTLASSVAVEAHFRNRRSNELALTIAGTVTLTGPPAMLTFALTDTQTELLAATPHTFSVWRVTDGAETPYATGMVMVLNTARTGL